MVPAEAAVKSPVAMIRKGAEGSRTGTDFTRMQPVEGGFTGQDRRRTRLASGSAPARIAAGSIRTSGSPRESTSAPADMSQVRIPDSTPCRRRPVLHAFANQGKPSSPRHPLRAVTCIRNIRQTAHEVPASFFMNEPLSPPAAYLADRHPAQAVPSASRRKDHGGWRDASAQAVLFHGVQSRALASASGPTGIRTRLRAEA